MNTDKFLAIFRHPLKAMLISATLLTLPLTHAATFQVINMDGAGEGFNDTTATSPVGGNSGTTLGQQRLNAFQHAANIWGGLLQSNVTIRVQAQFDPLTCSGSSAILGSAGPMSAAANFSGAPRSNTWYANALANALFGSDLNTGMNDIGATFNSAIGTTCAFPNTWYYGLDGNPPGNQVDFVTVLLHELGHGLGFLSFVDLSTGAKNSGYDDAYMVNLERHGASPADYPSMSNAQRLAASTDAGNLHWTGANVRAAASTLSAGATGDHVQMYAPNPAQSGSSVSHWSTVATPNQLMEPSYTQVIHTPVLELPLFQDIGWTLSGSGTNRTLTVATSGTGSGAVTSNPAGISCGADCSEAYATGTSVTLTASSAVGSYFSAWSGDCSGTSPSCTVTMSAAKSATAIFTAGSPVQPLRVTGLTGAAGSSQYFSVNVPSGATDLVVQLNGGTPDAGLYVKAGQAVTVGNADCSSSQPNTNDETCTFPQPLATTYNILVFGWGSYSGATLTATFMYAGSVQTLTVTKAGQGTGTVTSSPAGIDCGLDCKESFATNTTVTLAATPASGSKLKTWSGCNASSGNSCTVTSINAATSVTATFDKSGGITPILMLLLD